MLLRFRVSNFTSFNDTQEFSMIAGKPRLKMSHIYQDNCINTLKFAAIYGANAAGKSNIIYAIRSAQEIILKGLSGNLSNKYCRIDNDNRNKKSTFEFDIKVDDKYYSYGISIFLSSRQIVEEWLFELSKTENNESILLYSREFNTEEKAYHNNFEKYTGNELGILNAYADGISTNTQVTLLSIMNQENRGLCGRYPELRSLFAINDWFSSTLNVVTPNKGTLMDLFSSQHINKLPIKNFSIEELSEFLRVLGLGINSVRVSEMTRDEMKSQFVARELSILADSIPTNTEKEEVQQKYNICKSQIQEQKLQYEQVCISIDECKRELDLEFSVPYPKIGDIQISLKEKNQELKDLELMRKNLEQVRGGENGDSHNIDSELLDVIRNIEIKRGNIYKLRESAQRLIHLKKLNEIKVNTENTLKNLEEKSKIYQEKLKALSSSTPSESASISSSKSYLIHNSTPIGSSIIYYTPRGNDEEPEIKKIEFGHGKNNIYFELSEESDGTKRMIELLEILWAAKHEANKVYIVDEVDRSLHPDLTRNLVETFLKYSTKNSETQLIVTTHEARIMDLNLLRQDEIWFVDKNSEGYSNLYSLDEYDERFDRKVDKAYFEGRYGAIPMFNIYFPLEKSGDLSK